MSKPIINPKAELIFPTFVEFTANIKTFENDLAYAAQCRHCGGHMRGHIKAPGCGKLTEQQVNNTVLGILKERHNCPRKREQWGDKNLPQLIAPDIMRGFERLQEQALRNKKIGRA
jgi:hypothetical protein